MRKAINGKEEEIGFQLDRRRSRRVLPVIVTDLDFSDDIALISHEIEATQILLHEIETEAAKVGLHLNAKKTEVQSYNIYRPLGITSKNGEYIKEVNNFKELGAWTESSEKDFQVKKLLAWSACHKLKKIWSSSMSQRLKERLFIATVESVLFRNRIRNMEYKGKELMANIQGCYAWR